MANIGPNFGAIIIGMLINIMLYGVMLMQTYIYVTTYKRDRLLIRLFVTYLFIADTVNCGFMAAALYDYLVGHFGDLDYIAKASWVFIAADPAMTGLISCSVQVFFAWRIRVLSDRIWPSVIIGLCAVGSGLGAIGTAVAASNWFDEFVQFQKFESIVIVWLTGAALADVMIAASLVWFLKKKQTGFPVTDDVINRIVRLTVQTGMITAITAVIDLVLFLASSGDTHLLFNLPLSKLYTNSLMSSLNARSGWKSSDLQDGTSSGQLSRRGQEIGQLSRMNPKVIVNLRHATGTPPEAYESHAMEVRRPRPSAEPSREISFEDAKDGHQDAEAYNVFGQPKRYVEPV